MPQADGMILAKEEESDAEVRREDQDRINEFGGLNARLYEVRAEVKKLKVSCIINIKMHSRNIRIDSSCLVLLLTHTQNDDDILSLSMSRIFWKKLKMPQPN